MKSVLVSAALPLALAGLLCAAGTAAGADRDRTFFHSVEGKWVGPGEIVAGKYKGTKFNCSFVGSTPVETLGLSFDGGCRVGVFTQPMSAKVSMDRHKGYVGSFMGGSSGQGMDIVAGNVVDAHKVVFAINRKQLNGAMQARVTGENSMIVTVSVRVADQMIPVIGMNLKRVDATEVGTIAKN